MQYKQILTRTISLVVTYLLCGGQALALSFSTTPSLQISPLTTTTLTSPVQKDIFESGKLDGCTGTKVGETALADKNYEVAVNWTIKSGLNDLYYLVHVIDDPNYITSGNAPGANYAGVGGGLGSSFTLPTVNYKLGNNEPSKTVKLSVVAYDMWAKPLSSVTCQITLVNKQLTQTVQPADKYYTLPGLQNSSSGSLLMPPAQEVTYSPSGPGATTDSGSGTTSSDASSSPTSSGASGGTSNVSSNSTSSNTTAKEEEAALLPSPDILSCKGTAQTLYFKENMPAYDWMGDTCFLTYPSMVRAAVYTDAYDPKAEDNSGNLVKTISLDAAKDKGRSYFSWKGYDEYDQPAPLGKYKLVVEARPAANFSPDISIHNFTIDNPPAEVGAEAAGAETSAGVDNGATGNSAAGTAGEGAASDGTTGAVSTDNLHGAAPETEKPLLNQLGEAIFGSQPVSDGAASPEVGDANVSSETAASSPVEKEASKCPGVFYPIDIKNHPYEALIKKAYDECLTKGYPDGTFRIEQSLTRAEAAKLVILASGNLAKQGCYDNDCGAPFMDLDMWQGPWVRAAWDLKIVSGIAADRFAPNRQITRAEAVALIVKAFKIEPHYGCYDADCGAGLPDDPFNDITEYWQGPYLRALTDRGVLQTLTSGKFFPEQPITRGQMIELIYRVKSLAPGETF